MAAAASLLPADTWECSEPGRLPVPKVTVTLGIAARGWQETGQQAHSNGMQPWGPIPCSYPGVVDLRVLLLEEHQLHPKPY